MISWAAVSESSSLAQDKYCNFCRQPRVRTGTEIRCCLVPKSIFHHHDFHKMFEIHRNGCCLHIWGEQVHKNSSQITPTVSFYTRQCWTLQYTNSSHVSCAKTSETHFRIHKCHNTTGHNVRVFSIFLLFVGVDRPPMCQSVVTVQRISKNINSTYTSTPKRRLHGA